MSNYIYEKLGYFWYKEIKNSIISAKEEIKNKSVKSNIQILIKPFFLANETKNETSYHKELFFIDVISISHCSHEITHVGII